MATYEHNDSVKFILPAGYEYVTVYGDDGQEKRLIRTGLYYDDDGDPKYRFSCTVTDQTIEDNADNRGKTVRQIWECAFQRDPAIKKYFLDGKPDTLFVGGSFSMPVFGRELKFSTLSFAAGINQKDSVFLGTPAMRKGDSLDEVLEKWGNMLDIARSIRIKGKKAPHRRSYCTTSSRRFGSRCR